MGTYTCMILQLACQTSAKLLLAYRKNAKHFFIVPQYGSEMCIRQQNDVSLCYGNISLKREPKIRVKEKQNQEDVSVRTSLTLVFNVQEFRLFLNSLCFLSKILYLPRC